MKRIGPAFSSVFCLLLLLNCSSAAISGFPIKREWMLVSFKEYTKENLIRHQARINLTDPAQDGKIKGTAFFGCNKISFTATFKKNGTVQFSGISQIRTVCPEMKLENDFSTTFKKMQHYRLEGHFLMLNDNQGNSMKLIASDWD